MKNILSISIAIGVAMLLTACGSAATVPTATPIPSLTLEPQPIATTAATNEASIKANASTPCMGAPPPAAWNHVVVLIFEDKHYDEVIGPAPYITSLANQCATATDWQDTNDKVDGTPDGKYSSKPNYATLTNGLPPTVHGIVNNSYKTTTDVDNIYNQLNLAGKSFKDYYDGKAGGCKVRFDGDYHDPIRFYTNVTSICDQHDAALSTFMDDINSGNLPAFSVIIPNIDHNMGDNSVANGDVFAQSILDPLLNSQAYANGDVAIFVLWDEESPIPNVLIAPSVISGAIVEVSSGNPISHYSALLTWEEMLSLPKLGDTEKAPSLLPYFNGKH